MKRMKRLMPKGLGARLVLTVTVGSLAAAGFAACGGSDDDGGLTETPDSGPETSLLDTAPPKVDSGPGDSGTPDTGPVYDAGPPTVLDGGPLYEGGVPCVVGGQVEEEPNDDHATANPLSPSPTRCGVIFVDVDGGDAGIPEVDYVTFQLKDASTNFYLQFGGNVKLDVAVDGSAPVTLSATQSGTLPFVKGQPYFVKVYSADSKRTNWRVTLFEN